MTYRPRFILWMDATFADWRSWTKLQRQRVYQQWKIAEAQAILDRERRKAGESPIYNPGEKESGSGRNGHMPTVQDAPGEERRKAHV